MPSAGLPPGALRRHVAGLAGLLLTLGLLACSAVPPATEAGRGVVAPAAADLPLQAPAPAAVAPPGPPGATAPVVAPVVVPASPLPAAPAFTGTSEPANTADTGDATDAPPAVMARGLASWYGARFQGRRTASGERFDRHALTAAHRTLPFGTLVRVRSVRTGQAVVVRINDRGPHHAQRIIDLSEAAMQALGLQGHGVSEVELLTE